MKRGYLGEFEELVLLTVLTLRDNAYGVSIMRELAEQTGRTARLNQVHTALHRLLDKGMVNSSMSEPTVERGGRRKRMFLITKFGLRTLKDVQHVRASLWKQVPRQLKPSTL